MHFGIKLVMTKAKKSNLNLRAQPKYGIPDYSQVSIYTGNIPSIIKLLAIKINAIEISKLKIIIKV